MCNHRCYKPVWNDQAVIRDADEPTDALPGTEAKVEVMRSRLLRGLRIFHPDDADIGDGERDPLPLTSPYWERRFQEVDDDAEASEG
jgi:hypothetical protein